MLEHSVSFYKNFIFDDEVIELCQKLLDSFERFYKLTGNEMNGDEIVLISRKWKEVERKEALLLISPSDASVKKQNLTLALMAIINGLSDYYFDVLNGKIDLQNPKNSPSKHNSKKYWIEKIKNVVGDNYLNKDYLGLLFRRNLKIIKTGFILVAGASFFILIMKNRKHEEISPKIEEQTEEITQKKDFSVEQEDIYLELIEYGDRLYKQNKLVSAKIEYDKALSLAKSYNVNTVDLEERLRICRKAIREYKRHLKENPSKPAPVQEFVPMEMPQSSPKVIKY